jgi:hypothetical protein
MLRPSGTAQGWLIDADGIHELFPTDGSGLARRRKRRVHAGRSIQRAAAARPSAFDADAAGSILGNQLYDRGQERLRPRPSPRTSRPSSTPAAKSIEACVACHNHYVARATPRRDAKLPELPNRTPPPQNQ